MDALLRGATVLLRGDSGGRRTAVMSGAVVRGGIKARHLAALRRRAELVGVQERVDARRHRARVRVVDLQSAAHMVSSPSIRSLLSAHVEHSQLCVTERSHGAAKHQ